MYVWFIEGPRIDSATLELDVKPINYILKQQSPKKYRSSDDKFGVNVSLQLLIATKKILTFFSGKNCHQPLLQSLYLCV